MYLSGVGVLLAGMRKITGITGALVTAVLMAGGLTGVAEAAPSSQGVLHGAHFTTKCKVLSREQRTETRVGSSGVYVRTVTTVTKRCQGRRVTTVIYGEWTRG